MEETELPKIELVAFQSVGGNLAIRITDNGCGIPEENLNRVFVPFFTTRKDGSGIGLALCREIMRMRRGRISIDSRNTGTIVTLTFSDNP